MVSSEELIGTIEYLKLWTRCHIYRRRYNWIQLHMSVFMKIEHLLRTLIKFVDKRKK